MRSRPLSPPSAKPPERSQKAFSSSTVAVRPASERGRAELIRDVVDAYRRLYGSVQRFVLMLTDAPLNFASVGTSGSPSLNQLLSILVELAGAAAFARLRDLKTAIEEARSAEPLRDAIFSDALSNDLAALRKVATELDRLDTVFIGSCVGHVLEQHTRASHHSVSNTDRHVPVRRQSADRGRPARAKASAMRRSARAERALVPSGDWKR